MPVAERGMIPIIVILLAAGVGVGILSTKKAPPPQQAQVVQHHKKHKTASRPKPTQYAKHAPQAPPAQAQTPVADPSSGDRPPINVAARTSERGDFIPTVATNVDDLLLQCQQDGIAEVLKTSFRENSGLEPIQVNGVVVNPSYAAAITSHDNLDTLFPCMANIATDKGAFLFLFEVKAVGSVILLTGEFPAKQ